jgi:hypothetical protein
MQRRLRARWTSLLPPEANRADNRISDTAFPRAAEGYLARLVKQNRLSSVNRSETSPVRDRKTSRSHPHARYSEDEALLDERRDNLLAALVGSERAFDFTLDNSGAGSFCVMELQGWGDPLARTRTPAPRNCLFQTIGRPGYRLSGSVMPVPSRTLSLTKVHSALAPSLSSFVPAIRRFWLQHLIVSWAQPALMCYAKETNNAQHCCTSAASERVSKDSVIISTVQVLAQSRDRQQPPVEGQHVARSYWTIP